MKKFDAYKFYLFIETASSLLYFLAFTAMSIYEIRVAGLSPLQLVLVGTTLELTVLLCEVRQVSLRMYTADGCPLLSAFA